MTRIIELLISTTPLMRHFPPVNQQMGWKGREERAEYLLAEKQQTRASKQNCCKPPMLMGPPSVPARLHEPAHNSLVGHTIPHDRPTGLSDKIVLAAP